MTGNEARDWPIQENFNMISLNMDQQDSLPSGQRVSNFSLLSRNGSMKSLQDLD